MAGRGRPKGSHDLAPMIRGAFKMAARQLEDGGRPLSTIIREQLEERPLDTLRAIAAFVPKEMLLASEDGETLQTIRIEIEAPVEKPVDGAVIEHQPPPGVTIQ